MCQTDFCIIQPFCSPLARSHCQTWRDKSKEMLLLSYRTVTFPCRPENRAHGALRNTLRAEERQLVPTPCWTAVPLQKCQHEPLLRPVPAPAVPHCSLPSGKASPAPLEGGFVWRRSVRIRFHLFGAETHGCSSACGRKGISAWAKQKRRARAPTRAASVGREQELVPLSLSPGASPSWQRHRCSIAGFCLGTWNRRRRKTGCRLDKEKSSSGSDSVSILKSREKISYKHSFLQSGLVITLNTKSELYIFSKTKKPTLFLCRKAKQYSAFCFRVGC